MHFEEMHFRDQSIAAPLKHRYEKKYRMYESDFRDQSIAAPLKQ